MFVPLLGQYIGFSSPEQSPAGIVLLLFSVSPLFASAVSCLTTKYLLVLTQKVRCAQDVPVLSSVSLPQAHLCWFYFYFVKADHVYILFCGLDLSVSLFLKLKTSNSLRATLLGCGYTSSASRAITSLALRVKSSGVCIYV